MSSKTPSERRCFWWMIASVTALFCVPVIAYLAITNGPDTEAYRVMIIISSALAGIFFMFAAVHNYTEWD